MEIQQPISAHDFDGQAFRNESAHAELFLRCRSHLLSRLDQAVIGVEPFHHTFVEQIFPSDFYAVFCAHMLDCKYRRVHQDRTQDSPQFINRRYNLFNDCDKVASCIRALFSDPDVKQALVEKFYRSPSRELIAGLSIHEEFEYFFTTAGRFQNIHIDIPPKFLSCVFYIPELQLSATEEALNATILYDKSLRPHYPAAFRANSACIFAPHFYSYHGFSSTIDRDVMVLFYANRDRLAEWQSLRQANKDTAPYEALLDAIEQKLRAHPLIEFGDGDGKLLAERLACRVNAPNGRALV